MDSWISPKLIMFGEFENLFVNKVFSRNTFFQSSNFVHQSKKFLPLHGPGLRSGIVKMDDSTLKNTVNDIFVV